MKYAIYGILIVIFAIGIGCYMTRSPDVLQSISEDVLKRKEGIDIKIMPVDKEKTDKKK